MLEWGTCTHDDAKDGAPIDQTERRHDVTFFSVDVESRENLCTIFYTMLTKENIVYMSILWNFQKSEKRGKGKSNKISSKDAPRIHLIHPNVQNYIQKCLKIAPNVIKMNIIPI
jgi:hypothetical protein